MRRHASLTWILSAAALAGTAIACGGSNNSAQNLGVPSSGADAGTVASAPDAGTSAGGGSSGGTDGGTTGGGGTPAGASRYDQAVLADAPVAYWEMNAPGSGQEPDVTGHGHVGTYKSGTPSLGTMPNGDQAAVFDGSSQYLTIPSSAALSIPTTGMLTWEAWIRPDVLQFPNNTNGYVDWMGKCQEYSPTCEWEARMYTLNNSANRPSRLSAYVFNPTAGLGSGADFQPDAGVIQAGQWYHVVGEYQTLSQPSGCSGPQVGGINIWVNGVEWAQQYHGQTGCMSQYGVTPVANASPIDIGTMAFDSYFPGAIGKVAIYDHLLTPQQITAHFNAMTGRTPTGTCASTCNLGP